MGSLLGPGEARGSAGEAVFGGPSALSVVCAGDVVIFITGLLLLLVARPFVRAVQVSVMWSGWCKACVVAGLLGAAGRGWLPLGTL